MTINPTSAIPSTDDGSTVVDNLTIQNSFQLIEGRTGNAIQAIEDLGGSMPGRYMQRTRVLPDQHYRSAAAGKWDYNSNSEIRTAIDVGCLAQLVQTIALSDTIYVHADRLDSWGGGISTMLNEPKIVLPNHAKLLEPFIQLNSLNSIDRASILLEAFDDVSHLANTQEFRDYLGELSKQRAMSAFIAITNGYFATGYSDPSILPTNFEQDLWLKQAGSCIDKAKDLQDSVSHISNDAVLSESQRHEYAERHRQANVLIRQATIFKKVGSLVNDFFTVPTSEMEPRNHILGAAPAAKDLREQALGAEDVSRNILAAQYIGRMAAYAGHSYVPHPCRAPLAVFPYSIPNELQAQIDMLLGRVRDKREAYVKRNRETPFTACIDVNLPTFLTLALKQSTDSHDVLTRALEFRDDKRVRRLRKWLREIQERLTNESLGLDDIEKIQRASTHAMDRWILGSSKHEDRSTVTATATLNLGIITLGATRETKTRRQQGHGRDRRHMRVLQNIDQISNKTASLTPHLARVFGDKVALGWHQANGIFDMLDRRKFTSDSFAQMFDLRESLS